MYGCKICGRRFNGTRRTKTSFIKQLWSKYVFGKQTFRELSKEYRKDKRTLRAFLDYYDHPQKKHEPRPIHIIVDGTYFGERNEENTWCAVAARDQYEVEDLWWEFPNTETTSVYKRMRNDLELLGYTILSVTGDGFGGIRSAFSGISFQMCHVHMERIVVKGTTKHPQLEAGIILLALTRTLKETDSKTFHNRLQKYIEKYRGFLNEKTFNPETGRMCWTHEPLRKAVRSILLFKPWLFTFEQNKKIPKTTNSLEGHFRHTKDIAAVHCGLSRRHKERLLQSIFLAGTIAPSDEKLDEIL